MIESAFDPATSTLRLGGQLGFETVPDLIDRLDREILCSVMCIDVTALSKVDSAGVACLLWIRNQADRDSGLHLVGESTQLSGLIEVGGVRELLPQAP